MAMTKGSDLTFPHSVSLSRGVKYCDCGIYLLTWFASDDGMCDGCQQGVGVLGSDALVIANS